MSCGPIVVVPVPTAAVIVAPLGPQRVAVVVPGGQGPAGGQGIPGPAGGSAIQRTAGEVLSALRLVYEEDDKVFLLTEDDGEHIFQVLGLTMTAADTGDEINVQRSGPIDDAGWSWTPGPVWLGTSGNLTQTPPSGGFDLMVGVALSATRILLDLQQPIDL